MQSCKMDKIFIFAIFLFCAVGVLVTEKTNFVQFLRSRCHLKALYIFLLGLILFCYNQLFERKSKIDFPDFSKIVLSFCLFFVCPTEHNSETLGPIFLKFGLKNLEELRE